MMSSVRQWLDALGLSQYADAFEATDVDIDPLPDLNDQVLKDIGVASAGRRLRINRRLGSARRGEVSAAESFRRQLADSGKNRCILQHYRRRTSPNPFWRDILNRTVHVLLIPDI